MALSGEGQELRSRQCPCACLSDLDLFCVSFSARMPPKRSMPKAHLNQEQSYKAVILNVYNLYIYIYIYECVLWAWYATLPYG